MPDADPDAALDTHLDTKEARLESYKASWIPASRPPTADDAAGMALAGRADGGLETPRRRDRRPRSCMPTGCAPDAPPSRLRPLRRPAVDPLDCGPRRLSSRSSWGRITARGAVNRRVHAHVMAAGASRRRVASGQRQDVFEGEEESSQPPRRWLAASGAPRRGPAIISGTGFFEGNCRRSLSLRGLMYAQIDVVGTAVDTHSGGCGGRQDQCARVIAGLKGPDGGRIRFL